MNSNSDNALFEMQGCLICAICKGEVDYSESDEQSLSLKKMWYALLTSYYSLDKP